MSGKFITIAKDRTKNKSSLRTLPLITPFKELLFQIKKEQAEQRKLPKDTFQNLRHSCAPLLFPHGVSLKEIMDFNKKISSANAITGILGKEKESTSTTV